MKRLIDKTIIVITVLAIDGILSQRMYERVEEEKTRLIDSFDGLDIYEDGNGGAYAKEKYRPGVRDTDTEQLD